MASSSFPEDWLSLHSPHSISPAVSFQTMKALNSLLKGQVELFRLVQADARSEFHK